jgi:hypothetical protein
VDKIQLQTGICPMNSENKDNINQSTTPGQQNNFTGMDGINTRPITKGEEAYRDGYVRGRSIDESRIIDETSQYDRERNAENNGLTSGVIIGGILVFSVGLGAAVWAYANRDMTTQNQQIAPVTVPASPKPSVMPTAPAKQTTIIERTIEKAAPPEVKVIEVPKAAPAAPVIIVSPAPSQSSTSGQTPSNSATPSSSAPTPAPINPTPSAAEEAVPKDGTPSSKENKAR